MFPPLFFFLKATLTILGLLYLNVTFRIICSSSVKKYQHFDSHCIESVDCLG